MESIDFIKELVEKAKQGLDNLDNGRISIDLIAPIEGSSPEDPYMAGGWSHVLLTDVSIVDESGILFLTGKEKNKLAYVRWTAVSNIIFE